MCAVRAEPRPASRHCRGSHEQAARTGVGIGIAIAVEVGLDPAGDLPEEKQVWWAL